MRILSFNLFQLSQSNNFVFFFQTPNKLTLPLFN